MAWGSLFFVIVLGAPVGILFARRDFLSAFISCFMPIIVVYYPLDALRREHGQGRDRLSPIFVWTGNGTSWACSPPCSGRCRRSGSIEQTCP